jgi:tripartite ATP-independent transporter DctP family solute receptor
MKGDLWIMKASRMNFIAVVTLFVVFSAIFAGTGNAADAPVVLKAGEINPADHSMAKCLEHLGELVEAKSNGRIKVEVYAGGQLGDERTEIQAVQMGALDIFRPNTLTVGDFGAKKMNLFALPYLFTGREHLWKVLKSDLGREILHDVQESGSGMVALCYTDEGARNFFSKKEVRKPEDLKGMKIRVAETSILMDTVAAFGASPTPISYSELYTSLQTGVVDGADQPLVGYQSNSFQEVGPYMVLDGHTYSPGLIVISEIVWNRFSEDDRKILLSAAEETENFNRRLADETDQNALKILKERKAIITEPDDISAWQTIVHPLYEKYGKDYMDIVDAIRAMQ